MALSGIPAATWELGGLSNQCCDAWHSGWHLPPPLQPCNQPARSWHRHAYPPALHRMIKGRPQVLRCARSCFSTSTLLQKNGMRGNASREWAGENHHTLAPLHDLLEHAIPAPSGRGSRCKGCSQVPDCAVHRRRAQEGGGCIPAPPAEEPAEAAGAGDAHKPAQHGSVQRDAADI